MVLKVWQNKRLPTFINQCLCIEIILELDYLEGIILHNEDFWNFLVP